MPSHVGQRVFAGLSRYPSGVGKAAVFGATEVLGRLTEQNGDLPLPERSGHAVSPGYVELPWESSDTHLKYECYDQGAVVLSVEFELTGSA
jgi:hypothetical protein